MIDPTILQQAQASAMDSAMYSAGDPELLTGYNVG